MISINGRRQAYNDSQCIKTTETLQRIKTTETLQHKLPRKIMSNLEAEAEEKSVGGGGLWRSH